MDYAFKKICSLHFVNEMGSELWRQKFMTSFYSPYIQMAVNQNEGRNVTLTITQHLYGTLTFM